MKTGLLFGTFNPVHAGHLIIANYMSEFTGLEEVWMIVSPQNPLKPVNLLPEEKHRLKMATLAIGDHKKIKVCDAEFNLPKPSYTIHTLNYLKKNYPENEFVILMGTDNLEIFKKWKDYEEILKGYEIFVYPRLHHDGGELLNHTKVKFIDAPVIEISSSFIRKSIKEKKDVQFMMPAKVSDYITRMHFYE